jgi:DNA-binding NtrC family response regulator
MGRLNMAVVDADEQNCRELSALLEQANVPVAPLYSLEALSEHLNREQVGVLIVDLDTLPVNNNFFRSLKKKYANLHILCLSSRTHHPGLEEAMGSHIYASLAKPLNSEELFFWLKSIADL